MIPKAIRNSCASVRMNANRCGSTGSGIVALLRSDAQIYLIAVKREMPGAGAGDVQAAKSRSLRSCRLTHLQHHLEPLLRVRDHLLEARVVPERVEVGVDVGVLHLR